jgi:hypothetical protein
MLLAASAQLRDGLALAGECDLAQSFARSPFLVLKNLGAQIAEEREIETLYRIRRLSFERDVFDNDGTNEAERMIIFGYPIFIAEAAKKLKRERQELA